MVGIIDGLLGWTEPTPTPTYPKGSWGVYQKPKTKLSRSERRKLKRKLNLKQKQP